MVVLMAKGLLLWHNDDTKPGDEEKKNMQSEGIHVQASLCFFLHMRESHSVHSSCNNKHVILWPGNPINIMDFKDFFLEACHLGTLCLSHTKIPGSQKGSRLNKNPTVCKSSLGIMNYLYHLRNGGKSSKIQVSNTC